MKRILCLLLVLACTLGGCSRSEDRQPDLPEPLSGEAQNTIEPIQEAGTALPGGEGEREDAPPEPAEPEPVADSEPEPAPEPDPDPGADAGSGEQADERADEPAPADETVAQETASQAAAPAQAELEPDAPLEQHAGGEPSFSILDVFQIDAGEFETELLRLINNERRAAGVEVLGLEETLRWAARIRAPEALDSLSHTRPDGTPYYTAMDEAGFTYAGKWHGENVSSMYFTRGYYDTASAAAVMFEQLRSSPGHNNNMLSENFSQIGIGVSVIEDGDTIRIGSAQLFASF